MYPQQGVLDWLIEDILQAPSTMSGDLRACKAYKTHVFMPVYA